jgi:hypothetical protein
MEMTTGDWREIILAQRRQDEGNETGDQAGRQRPLELWVWRLCAKIISFQFGSA